MKIFSRFFYIEHLLVTNFGVDDDGVKESAAPDDGDDVVWEIGQLLVDDFAHLGRVLHLAQLLRNFLCP
jgi:hypothetical protein